jgi:hypothetical protein
MRSEIHELGNLFCERAVIKGRLRVTRIIQPHEVVPMPGVAIVLRSNDAQYRDPIS